MARFRVGVQLQPQSTSVAELRSAWRAADTIGVDSIWLWDHFFPLYGDPSAANFEGYTLLAAMAVETAQADVGVLVSCNSYRNPSLLADMARTVDHLSGGRTVLGIGAGWFERDYEEYGYEFGTPASRLRDLEHALPVVMDRLGRLEPPPLGRLPVLVGVLGDAWNSFGPPARYAERNRVLDDWCERVGRNPRQIERTVAIDPADVGSWEAYLEAGAEHVIVMTRAPYDLDPVRRLLDAARA